MKVCFNPRLAVCCNSMSKVLYRICTSGPGGKNAPLVSSPRFQNACRVKDPRSRFILAYGRGIEPVVLDPHLLHYRPVDQAALDRQLGIIAVFIFWK